MAALLEQVLGMRLLKVAAACLVARNLRRNRKDGHAAPITIEEPVDQVKIARPATARANGDLSRQMRLGAGGEISADYCAGA